VKFGVSWWAQDEGEDLRQKQSECNALLSRVRNGCYSCKLSNVGIIRTAATAHVRPLLGE
jgi:hypothetical protein